jgi:hypothetical protein
MEPTVMREKPKAKISVWVMMKHNLMDIGAEWNQQIGRDYEKSQNGSAEL